MDGESDEPWSSFFAGCEKASVPKAGSSARSLGWLDSNQRMTESKSVALPLGYTPSDAEGEATQFFGLRSQPLCGQRSDGTEGTPD